MEIKIKWPDKDPVPVLTLDSEHFCEEYMTELSPAQISHILNTYKEVNILYDDYRLDFAIKRRGIWYDFTVKAPKGMALNGSSVPAIGKALVNEDYHNRAWIAHDLVYIFKGRKSVMKVGDPAKVQIQTPRLTRKEIDKVFIEVVKLTGAPRFQRWLAYTAIRVGGGLLWRQPFTSDAIIIVQPK